MKHQLKLLLPLLFLTPIVMSCGDDDDRDNGIPAERNLNRNDTSREPALQRLEFPKVKGGNSIVIIHTNNDLYGINYSVEWDCDKKSQRWSCYQMYAANKGGSNSRVVDGYLFDEDMPNHSINYVTNSSGENIDPFWSSGYDHGHICPNADRKYSREANRQTFFLTNMQPQRNKFNAGIWLTMENRLTNTWWPTSAGDTLFVVKGGTIDAEENIIEYICNNQRSQTAQRGYIPVPKYFFMALLRKTKRKSGTDYKAMGFWVEHLNEDHKTDPLSDYVVNIRKLEQLTGIDFFCNLPDDIEEEVETVSIENLKWLWNL
ncbi:MAG: DNA/RNA non-specific endonuclease [Prevotella sp.]|nr:DNA/RNA non-specific endonuclease [Prevotella sp.]